MNPDIENIAFANICDHEAALSYSGSIDWEKFKEMARARRQDKRQRMIGKGF
ncbi:hypothetical protein ACVIGB_005224 [Bradyrhizobium sp. USDA 4341]